MHLAEKLHASALPRTLAVNAWNDSSRSCRSCRSSVRSTHVATSPGYWYDSQGKLGGKQCVQRFISFSLGLLQESFPRVRFQRTGITGK